MVVFIKLNEMNIECEGRKVRIRLTVQVSKLRNLGLKLKIFSGAGGGGYVFESKK